MSNAPSKSPLSHDLWVIFCAFCCCAGWVLSALHALTPAGYVVAFGLGAIALWLWWRACGKSDGPKTAQGGHHSKCRRLLRRFRRPVPMTFLVLAVLVFLGGALYAPSNYDALAYRMPRVLHWLAEGRWHWIHTEFPRLNTRGCGYEWLAAPMLALARTDRLLFLPNFIAFCMMPGLIFSSFRRMGVRPRVAYNWMWVLPVGYCFLLQAGSLANDLLAGFFVLAALDYGLRARESQRIGAVWLSILAAGLATAVKANGLLLLPAWLVAVAPCWRLVGRRAFATALVCLVALGASFAPNAFFNWKHLGDWSGLARENIAPHGISWPAMTATAGVMVISNFEPPIAPFAKRCNERLEASLPPRFTQALTQAFGESEFPWKMDELQIEERAGLGVGVCALLAVSMVAAIALARRTPQLVPGRMSLTQGVVLLTALGGVAALVRIGGGASSARLLNALYPFFVLTLLLHRGQSRVVRRRWWQAGAVVAALVAVLVLVLNPARPLLPMGRLVGFLQQRGWAKQLTARADRVYSVYAERPHAFEPALRCLPAEAKVVGAVTGDDPEMALWKPFGSRRVVHVCPGDSAQGVRALGLSCILVSAPKFQTLFHTSMNDWLAQINGEIVQTIPLSLRAGEPPAPWHLVRLRSMAE